MRNLSTKKNCDRNCKKWARIFRHRQSRIYRCLSLKMVWWQLSNWGSGSRKKKQRNCRLSCKVSLIKITDSTHFLLFCHHLECIRVRINYIFTTVHHVLEYFYIRLIMYFLPNLQYRSITWINLLVSLVMKPYSWIIFINI